MTAFTIIEGDVVVRSSDGIEMAVVDAAALPASTRGFISVGYDGTNTRFVRVDSSGHQYVLSNQLPVALVGGRLDTNVGAWLGSTVPTVGQKAMASSIPVALASDQSAIPVSQNGTWTVQQGTPPWAVEGTDANGAAPTENPVFTAGWDSTNIRIFLTDTSGRSRIVGAGASGAAEVGDPVRVAGSDGTNTWNLLTDSGGRQVAVGAASDGATPVGDPVLTAGWDGTNVKRVKTNSSGRIEEVLYDGSGNAVGVVLDGALYRLQVDGKIAKGASSLVHAEAIDTVSGIGRLTATLYSPDGDAVAFPTASSALKNDFVRETGGSADLRVDGSVTEVDFTYAADSTYDVSIQEIKFTMVSNSITFGSDYFGSTSGPLTNGVCVTATVNGGTTVQIYDLHQNESFVNFASPGGFEWVVSSKDLMASTYLIGGGLKLLAGTADNIKVCVRDDIDTCAVYFKCFVKGNLLTG